MSSVMRGLDPRIHPLCKQRALLRWIAGSSPAMTKSERWAPSIPSPRRISAVGVEDVPGVEVRRPRGEEQERAGEVRRLAEPAFGHAGEEALADVAGAFGVLVHPCGQRRAEDRRPQRIDRDAGFAELAAQRLGDAVDRRFRCAISGVAGRMSQQPARRGSQDDLAAEAIAVLALLEHLPGGGARHQPGLGDVGVHHVEEIFRLLVDDLRYLVEAGGDHQDVEPAEGRHRGGDDRVAIFRGAWPLRNDRGNDRALAAQCLAFGGDFLEFVLPARRQRDVGAGAGEHLGGERAERPRRAGYDRRLAPDVEQGGGVFQEIVGHGFSSQAYSSPHGAKRNAGASHPPLQGEGRIAEGDPGWGDATQHVRKRCHPLPAASRPTSPLQGEVKNHFGGADIATIMVTTSLPRLMISRSSLGPMKQLSFALSTVSLPPAITVNSPERTTYTFSVGEASGPAPPPGRKCERPTTNCFGPPASRPNRRSDA